MTMKAPKLPLSESEPLTDADLERTISHQQLAALTGYSEQTFRKTLAVRGYIPAPVRGKYRLAPTLAGFHRYLREQVSKTLNRQTREDSKCRKLDLQIARLERELAERDGELLTVQEWEHLAGQFFHPLIQMLKDLLEVDIPATCSGLSEAALRFWCRKRLEQVRGLWENAEKRFDPREVVANRRFKKEVRGRKR